LAFLTNGSKNQETNGLSDDPGSGHKRLGFQFGLSTKLLLLTTAFVMLAEVLIFVPSVANFRKTWLTERLAAGQIAAFAAQAARDEEVPEKLGAQLLDRSMIHSLTVNQNGARRLIMKSPVPGMVDAGLLALREFGTKSFEEIIQPAIQLADGFPIDRTRSRSISDAVHFLKRFPTSLTVFAPHGQLPQPGEIFRQPDLARTLRSMVAAEQKARDNGANREDARSKVLVQIPDLGGPAPRCEAVAEEALVEVEGGPERGAREVPVAIPVAQQLGAALERQQHGELPLGEG